MKLLTELQCIEAIQGYLQECDCDELARLTGELFGGACSAVYPDKENPCVLYEFEPNEYYGGHFDTVDDE